MLYFQTHNASTYIEAHFTPLSSVYKQLHFCIRFRLTFDAPHTESKNWHKTPDISKENNIEINILIQ